MLPDNGLNMEPEKTQAVWLFRQGKRNLTVPNLGLSILRKNVDIGVN